MVLYPTSDVEVARIVNSLKGSSASSLDCIPTMAVKFILPSIISPLTKLVNLSFENGIFPSSLKRAKIIVLYKSGRQKDPANYRPISLLSDVPDYWLFSSPKVFFMIFSLASELNILRNMHA